MSEDEDLALQTLLMVRGEAAPDLDEHLLRDCYMVQRRYQFSADRTQSSVAMERLIDQAVESAAAEAGAAS